MSLFEQLVPAVKFGKPVQVITLIAAPQGEQGCIGQMLAIHENGSVSGLLRNQIFTELVVNTIDKLVWQKPDILTIEYGGQYRLFWDFWQGKPGALILGGGHISQPLVELLSLTGFQVTVIDDRPDFANRVRFPKAENVICDGFAKALKGKGADQFQSAVIVTRGHRHDLECLRKLINTEIFYLGMIGSRRRVASIQQLLLDEGIKAERLQRLRSPIGLDIGAQTPAEIAMSIAAEIIAVLRGGTYLPLSSHRKGGK